MFFSEGGGVALLQELDGSRLRNQFGLDSLTNCIKRQSCPWSAPQLIDGSTRSHRKSSAPPTERRQISRLALLPAAARLSQLPLLPPPVVPFFSHKTPQIDSKQSQISSNLYVELQTVHQQHIHAYQALYM